MMKWQKKKETSKEEETGNGKETKTRGWKNKTPA
jgi:hypothetical protein